MVGRAVVKARRNAGKRREIRAALFCGRNPSPPFCSTMSPRTSYSVSNPPALVAESSYSSCAYLSRSTLHPFFALDYVAIAEKSLVLRISRAFAPFPLLPFLGFSLPRIEIQIQKLLCHLHFLLHLKTDGSFFYGTA